jgi:hypothetical protein
MQTRQRRGLHLRPLPREERCKVISLLQEQGPSTRPIGLRKRFGKQTPTSKQNNEGHDMSLLTPEEKSFLDVFLHEATTAPFTGTATHALHGIGVEYADIPYIAWAYEQDVPRKSFALGHAADVAPPLPWPTRESALQRNKEVQRIWDQKREPANT